MSNPKPAQRRRLGNAAELSPPSSRSACQPRLEVLAPVVALGAIVVWTNAGDVKRVMPKLARMSGEASIM